MADHAADPFHDEPVMDVAHLGHVELVTPRLDASVRFFTDVLGMTVSGEAGGSVFLRGWDDYERYSLMLTAGRMPALGHAAFRARSAPALARRVAALEASGLGVGWHEGSHGHGPAYRFRDPDGHLMEIYWETERFVPGAGQVPYLKNQAQRYPARGISVRRLDHFNCLAVDVRANREFFQRALGFRLTEMILLDSGIEAGMWMTATNKSYDFAFTREAHGVAGRFHHVTYAVDSREDILRAADVFMEHGVAIETGPHKHAIQQTFFLYVFEPGGHRVEIANAGARLVLAPDWRPVVWTEAERRRGQAWGLKTIETFHTLGAPPLPGQPGHVEG